MLIDAQLEKKIAPCKGEGRGLNGHAQNMAIIIPAAMQYRNHLRTGLVWYSNGRFIDGSCAVYPISLSSRGSQMNR